MKLPFRRKPQGGDDGIAAELDRDLKGRTPIYVDGTVIPDRRKERRPPPKSPGMHAEDPIDDPLPMPFVPPPKGWGEDTPEAGPKPG